MSLGEKDLVHHILLVTAQGTTDCLCIVCKFFTNFVHKKLAQVVIATYTTHLMWWL